jgi:hypothetical protein
MTYGGAAPILTSALDGVVSFTNRPLYNNNSSIINNSFLTKVETSLDLVTTFGVQ